MTTITSTKVFYTTLLFSSSNFIVTYSSLSIYKTHKALYTITIRIDLERFPTASPLKALPPGKLTNLWCTFRKNPSHPWERQGGWSRRDWERRKERRKEIKFLTMQLFCGFNSISRFSEPAAYIYIYNIYSPNLGLGIFVPGRERK